MKTLIRITTVPSSLKVLLRGQLAFINKHYDILVISSHGDELCDVSTEQGVRNCVVNMSRKITPLKDLIALFKLYLILKKERPYIVHTHTPKAGIIGMLSAKLAGVPHRLHTVAGLPLMEAKGIKRLLLNLVEKLTYTCATMVYPNSKGLQKFILHARFCKKNKLKIIGNGSSNGIDTKHFRITEDLRKKRVELRNKEQMNDHTVAFCYIGRLVGDKGLNELISAYVKIKFINSNVRLYLVGDYENELDPLSKETNQRINGDSSIIKTGFVHDVRPFLAASDIFVFPSYREGFPNVVLQAVAMELPCIVTNINGCNEIIQDHINGILIPPKDKMSLFEAMMLLLKDHNKRIKLASMARKQIEGKFEQTYIWNELLKEYKSLEKSNP